MAHSTKAVNPVTVLIGLSEQNIVQNLHETFPYSEIIEVKTGIEAIAKCIRQHVDIALLPLHLPDGNGFKTASQLKRINPALQVWVITPSKYGSFFGDVLLDGWLDSEQPNFDLLAKSFRERQASIS